MGMASDTWSAMRGQGGRTSRLMKSKYARKVGGAAAIGGGVDVAYHMMRHHRNHPPSGGRRAGGR